MPCFSPAVSTQFALALALLVSGCSEAGQHQASDRSARGDSDSSRPQPADEEDTDSATDERRDAGRADEEVASTRDAARAADPTDAARAPGDASLPDSDPRDDAAASGDADTGEDAECDRACLLAINTAYLDALVANDAALLKTAPDVRFTENGEELALSEGLWAVASKLRGYRQDWTEPSLGQTAGFVALDDARGAVLLAFRLKVEAGAVSEIETIVARQGEATFFAPNNLTARDPIFDELVPPSERASRDEMVAIAELYFDGLDSGDGSDIPVAVRANRNENGTVTASGTRIQNVSMFSYIEEITRRYVIVDEERGHVLAFALFEIPRGIGGSSRTLHLAEAFKVQGGEIHRILAFMVNQPLGTPSGWE